MFSGLTIRRAMRDESAIIAKHRADMFTDMGVVPNADLAEDLTASTQAYLAIALGDGSYVGWLASDQAGQIVGGAGVYFMPQVPRLSENRTHVVKSPMPVVQNVYVVPAWRRKGLARALMKTVTQWAAAQGLDRLVLHASEEGRALYTSMGFSATREMSLTLAPPRSHPTAV